MKFRIALLLLIPVVATAAQLTIQWADNSDNENGFTLERSVNGFDFLPIADVAPDTETYTDSSLLPGVEYWYRVKAFNAAGESGYSNTASAITAIPGEPPASPGTINLTLPGRLTNISARGLVDVGSGILIGGFVIEDGPVAVLLRAVGPTIGLPPYSVPFALDNPSLILLQPDGTEIASNDDWSGQDIADAADRVGAFALPVGSLDSALITTLPPGSYTFHVTGVGGSTGVALFEAYQLN